MANFSSTPNQQSFAASPIFVEGYTGQLSYEAGNEITFHISSSVPEFSVEIARIGAEREVVLTKSGLPGAEHPIPENAASYGCGWPVTFTETVPKAWRSGYYSVTVSVEDHGGTYVQRGRRTATNELFFIVRSTEPGKDTSILLQLATNTYNAYNNWGGYSLYEYNALNKTQAHRVSFDRPMIGQFGNWEKHFVEWAETNGYTLDFAANDDLEFRPELLENYRLILSVGHDEYWSSPMRDHLEAFIASGGNVAFLSGNTCCWQIRCEDNGRAHTCYKQWFNHDPIYGDGDQSLLATLWAHPLIGRPENELTGVGFRYGGYHLSHGQFMDGKGEFTVHQPGHWLFEGAGLKQNDTFGAADTIGGYECDGCEFVIKDGVPVPTYQDGTPETFQILATCPSRWEPNEGNWFDEFDKDRIGAAMLGIYEKGGTVVTSGTTDWAHGLRGNDPHVVQITKNVLDKLSR